MLFVVLDLAAAVTSLSVGCCQLALNVHVISSSALRRGAVGSACSVGCKQSISTVWTAIFECTIGGPMSSTETVDVGKAVSMMFLGTGYFFVSSSVSRIGDL